MSAAPPARLIARRRCGQVRAIMPYAPDRSSRLCELSWLLRSRVGVQTLRPSFHREEPTFHHLIRSDTEPPAHCRLDPTTISFEDVALYQLFGMLHESLMRGSGDNASAPWVHGRIPSMSSIGPLLKVG